MHRMTQCEMPIAQTQMPNHAAMTVFEMGMRPRLIAAVHASHAPMEINVFESVTVLQVYAKTVSVLPPAATTESRTGQKPVPIVEGLVHRVVLAKPAE